MVKLVVKRCAQCRSALLTVVVVASLQTNAMSAFGSAVEKVRDGNRLPDRELHVAIPSVERNIIESGEGCKLRQ